jgi:MraZ protein
MVFSDVYERTIDDKKRIQIPAQFRSNLDPERHGETFYLTLGERPNTLALYPDKLFEADAEELRTDQVSGDDALTFEQLYYSLASRLEMDKQGRVVLPERQLSLVELGSEITLAGAGLRIDIWSTAQYREFVKQTVTSRWSDMHQFRRRMLERRANRGAADGIKER